MGTYIYAYCEKRNNDKWMAFTVPDRASKLKYSFQVWDFQSYSVFGWLANVRNDAQVPHLSLPRGLPEDVSDEVHGVYKHLEWAPQASWVSLKELTEFDYEQEFHNFREYGEDGKPKIMKLKELFGQIWWTDLVGMMKEVSNPDDIRIVFWFD